MTMCDNDDVKHERDPRQRSTNFNVQRPKPLLLAAGEM
jgi:hypothetical protein